MNCPGCAHDNPATVSYCQRCGGKLDLTVDEISASLAEELRGETATDNALRARRILVGATVFFLLALTVHLFAGNAPESAYHVPSVSNGGEHLEYRYRVEVGMERLEIGSEEKK